MTHHTIISLVTLLAQGSYKNMGSRFRRGGGGTDSIEFLIMVGALLAIVVTALVVNHYVTARKARGFESPRALFGELCRAHSLNWPARRLMRKLAAHHGVPVCQLFLAPEHFQTEGLPPRLQNQTPQIAELRNQLFAN